jgi:predicted RND superfamily exporter protein
LFRSLEDDAISSDSEIAKIIALTVWLYLSYHLESLFLGTSCIIQILVSIPISLAIYKIIFGISYFCPLHLFVGIIIMGIGADDIFVFHDQWKHTSHIKVLKKRIALRLAYAFRKASSAMFVTSCTTAVSFLATTFSPVMPICSFGIFSSLVITVNYILIMIALPNIYLFYERYINKRFNCFKYLKKKAKESKKKIRFPRKHKYDEMSEVIIPKNVDLDEENPSGAITGDIVNP